MVDLVTAPVVSPVLAIIVAEVGGGAVCGHSSFPQSGDGRGVVAACGDGGVSGRV